jgi:hypothetical protein
MLLSYETVFSRTLGRINDPKELSLNEDDLTEIYIERLHNVIGNPRVRRLFSSLSLDDISQQIKFSLNNSVDEDSDKDFICNIFILGMTIEWLQPQVDSLNNVLQMIGGKEEKMLNNPYKNLQSRLEDTKKELNKIIRDYGYMYNSYINSKS